MLTVLTNLFTGLINMHRTSAAYYTATVLTFSLIAI